MFDTDEEKRKFLSKYGIDTLTFEQSCIDWSTLESICQSYSSFQDSLQRIVKKYSRAVETFESVHSVSGRVKDVEHLCEKIIRNNQGHIQKGRSINVENYCEYIRDLVGIRILHLYKDDWSTIHDNIVEYFGNKLIDSYAYVRQGDNERLYEGHVRISEHRPYRSVHYVVKDESGIYIELQVRTLFEEAWGEIDHNLRYPYDMHNKMINEYMDILSQLMGMGNEMSSFIHGYIKQFKMYNSRPTEENDVLNRIMETTEKINDKEVREEIQLLIKNAENYREQVKMKDLLDDFFARGSMNYD